MVQATFRCKILSIVHGRMMPVIWDQSSAHMRHWNRVRGWSNPQYQLVDPRICLALVTQNSPFSYAPFGILTRCWRIQMSKCRPGLPGYHVLINLGRTRKMILNGAIKVTAQKNPAFLYEGETPGAYFDPNDVVHGFLRGFLLERVSPTRATSSVKCSCSQTRSWSISSRPHQPL